MYVCVRARARVSVSVRVRVWVSGNNKLHRAKYLKYCKAHLYSTYAEKVCLQITLFLSLFHSLQITLLLSYPHQNHFFHLHLDRNLRQRIFSQRYFYRDDINSFGP